MVRVFSYDRLILARYGGLAGHDPAPQRRLRTPCPGRGAGGHGGATRASRIRVGYRMFATTFLPIAVLDVAGPVIVQGVMSSQQAARCTRRQPRAARRY